MDKKSHLAKSCSMPVYFSLIVVVVIVQLSLVDSCSIDLNTCSHLFSHQQQKNSRHHEQHLFDHEVTFESRLCFCDKHCKTYRDCCKDFDHVAPEAFRRWKEPQLESVKHAELLFDCNLYIHDDGGGGKDSTASFAVNGAFSVNKCTVPETSDEAKSIADRCVVDLLPIDAQYADLAELNGKLKEHDPLLLLPVSIKQRHETSQPLTYRNIYCAICNNVTLSESDMRKIEFWQLGASCLNTAAASSKPEETAEAPKEVKDRNCVVTYKRGHDKSMKSMAHNGVRKCKPSKSRCVEDRNLRRLGEPNFSFDLEELDSISRNCHSFQSFRYQDDLRYRNKFCGMCNNIGSESLLCEPRNLERDVQQLLARVPSRVDLSYENNRVLLNQSTYRPVIEAKYEMDKRTITFINHLDEQQGASEPSDGRSVKELASFEHVLYWKSLPASVSPAMSSSGLRSLAICLSSVVFIYLFL